MASTAPAVMYGKEQAVGTLHDASVTLGQRMPVVPEPSPSSQVVIIKICQVPSGACAPADRS